MNKMKRRNRVDLMTTEEKQLLDISYRIEALGSHPILTEVVELLAKARSKLSDFNDQTLGEDAED